MTEYTQGKIMQMVLDDTHALWSEEFLDKVNAAFGTQVLAVGYKVSGDPKGLTLKYSLMRARGIASFDLMPKLCEALGVKYEAKLGRGFQVRACVEALAAAGYPKDGIQP